MELKPQVSPHTARLFVAQPNSEDDNGQLTLVEETGQEQNERPVEGRNPLEGLSLEEIASYLLNRTTGLDISGQHGVDTPKRFIKMLQELTTPEQFTFTVFENEEADQMIVVRDIPFTSVCNHHIVPFIGKADIGYVAKDNIAGLSKFARTVKFFARKLQTQERLTNEIADYIEEKLEPHGVAVVLRAEHLCMTIRGVQSPGTHTYTAAMRGVFADHSRTAKAEFMEAINGHGSK